MLACPCACVHLIHHEHRDPVLCFQHHHEDPLFSVHFNWSHHLIMSTELYHAIMYFLRGYWVISMYHHTWLAVLLRVAVTKRVVDMSVAATQSWLFLPLCCSGWSVHRGACTQQGRRSAGLCWHLSRWDIKLHRRFHHFTSSDQSVSGRWFSFSLSRCSVPQTTLLCIQINTAKLPIFLL